MKELFGIDFLKSIAWSEKLKEIALLFVCIFLLTVSMVWLHGDFKKSAHFKSGEVAPYTIRASKDISSEEGSFIDIKRGQVVVRAGDVVTSSQEKVLLALDKSSAETTKYEKWFSYVVICTVVLLTVYLFCINYWPGVLYRVRDLTLISSALIGSFLFVKFASSVSQFFPYSDPTMFVLAAPVAAGGLLLQVTLGGAAVFIFVLTFGLLTGVFLDNSGLVLLLIVSGNLVGALSIKSCSKRSAFLVAAVRIAIINCLLVLSFALLFHDASFKISAIRLCLAFASGIFSGVLGTGLLPVAEFIGGYITDIKMLELASLDRPLLRELSTESPGTWNHSIVMGQMAEVAATAIGANGLLARVGAYYHDIGKISKAEYFVENQKSKENKHDKLTPSMSALIIKSHVKDGIELAKQHNLPKAIQDFIPQHHGTSLIEFFYEKAKKEADEGEEVSESHYRYLGPKPQTKETGILMLADAIEASSRTLSDPNQAKIQGMVQKMINKVFASGELEESNLTLKDLHLIARSFTRVLTGIYHKRIEYAEPVEKGKDKSDKEQEKESKGKKEKKESKQNGNGRAESKDRKDKDGESGKSDEDSAEALKRLGI